MFHVILELTLTKQTQFPAAKKAKNSTQKPYGNFDKDKLTNSTAETTKDMFM